nr:helix-turn-helix transcriptional regulator [Escherichia coli]
MSKQWRLCHLSDKLFMSEVNIRKKLEKENITFNNLLLDLRMNFSARLLNTTEMHVSNIAKKSGYSNVSYFIKVFKDYFGVTPRQYNLKIRGRTMCP